MKIIPFNNLVLVREIEEDKKRGVIYMSDRSFSRYIKYEVIEVGSKVDWMKSGDIVYGNPTPSNEEFEDGSKFINCADLFGRVEE